MSEGLPRQDLSSPSTKPQLNPTARRILAEIRQRQAATPPPEPGRPSPQVVTPAPFLESTSRVESSAITELGFREAIGPRKTMEDAHVVVRNFGGKPNQAFLGVFDGHSPRGTTGKPVAEFVASRLPANYLATLNTGTDPKMAFRQAYHLTDQQLKTSGLEVENSGATAVTAFLQGDRLYVANAGDSRAVLIRGGQAKRLSFDDKPGDPRVKARIEAAGGQVSGGKFPRVEGQLAVARGLGDFGIKKFVPPEPHRAQEQFQPGDTHLVLACDGVWDVFSDQGVADLIANFGEPNPSAQKISDRLVQTALLRGTGDNVTVIVAKLNPSTGFS